MGQTLEQKKEQIRRAEAKSIRSKAKVKDALPFFKDVYLTGYPGEKAEGPERRDWLIAKLEEITKPGDVSAKKPRGKKRNVVESNRLKTITKAGDASAKKTCGKKRKVVESNSAAPKRAKKQTAGGSTQADSSTLVARGKPKQQSDATGNELSQNSYARTLIFSSERINYQCYFYLL